MLASEILSEVRQKLTDVLEPNLWSDAELLAYLRDALDYIYTITGYGRSIIQLTTTPFISSYPVTFDIVRAYIDETCLNRTDSSLLVSIINISPKQGCPTMYAVFNNTLYLYPIPDDAYTIDMVVRPSVSIDFDTDISFPDIKLLVYGTILNAFDKNDIEIVNPALYSVILQKYNSYMLSFKSTFIRDNDEYTFTKILGGLL